MLWQAIDQKNCKSKLLSAIAFQGTKKIRTNQWSKAFWNILTLISKSKSCHQRPTGTFQLIIFHQTKISNLDYLEQPASDITNISCLPKQNHHHPATQHHLNGHDYVWNRVSDSPGWPWTHFVAEDILALMILLPPAYKCWDYRYAPPYLVS